eukprot:gene16907-20105_t
MSNSIRKATKCYYEVLEVARTATDTELKKAYRRLALVWHPDKNQDQLVIADEKFKEINHAYSTLSDPNERKWYDDHREAILRGTTDEDDDVSHLWAFFSTACYDGFDDGERGFYTVYRAAFDDIAKTELEADDDFNPLSGPVPGTVRAPSFGTSDAPIAEVMRFYTYWKEFVTKRKFAYADTYNTTEAPNRQIKRLMEKENSRERSAKRTEYNEQVRHLVAHIQKRDRRLQEYQKKQREEAEAKAIEDEKQRIIDEEEHKEAVRRHREEQREEFERAKKESSFKYMEASNVITEEDVSEFYCIVCDKMFRSDRQLKNHENSNKHRANLVLLRSNVGIEGLDGLEDEVEALAVEDDEVADEPTITTTSRKEEPVLGMASKKKKDKKKKKGKKVIGLEDDLSSEEEMVMPIKKKIQVESDTEQEQQDQDDDDDDEEMVMPIKKKNITTPNKHLSEDEEEDEEEEEEDQMDKKKKIKNPFLDSSDEEDKKSTTPVKKVGKAKEKRLQRQEKLKQKAAQGAVATPDSGAIEDLCCHVCKEVFPTRNKLFLHIKATKHAQAIVTPSGSGKRK